MPDLTDLPDLAETGFVPYAGGQLQRVELLVARGETADPEFRKNLLIFRGLVGAAIDLYRRAASAPEAAAVLAREDTLRERITLPDDLPLTLELLLARRFELEQLLIEVGDRRYLTSRLAELYDEGDATQATWQELYGAQLPGLLPGSVDVAGMDSRTDLEATRRRLARLMHVKQAGDQVSRARWELKLRAARLVLVVLILVAAGFAAAVAWAVPNDAELIAAAAAGAAGAALGGLLRLRDEIRLGTQVRQFAPFFLGGVVVGFTAGLVTFLVDRSGIVQISGEGAGVAAFGFAVGFSEAAFVGMLTQLAASVGRRQQPAAPRGATEDR